MPDTILKIGHTTVRENKMIANFTELRSTVKDKC